MEQAAGQPLRILYEDDAIVAVDKPAGMLVIPGRQPSGPTLVEQVHAYLKASGQRAYVVHRLDQGTSGVVLFARDADAHRALNLAFEQHAFQKRYLGLVQGRLGGAGVIRLALHPARRGRMRPALHGEEGKAAITEWKSLETFADCSLIELSPRTGRQHQLRVHLKWIGHPLAFDPDYGSKTPFHGLARTPLHAASIRGPHPGGRSIIDVSAPLPEDLSRVLQEVRTALRSTPNEADI